MKVADIPTVKLTKRGDSLAGTVSRSRNLISKHVKEHLDIVILAGTNDLTTRDVSPESLIEELDSSITELKQFSNLDNVFICKIPARLDRSLINRKVALYNELLVERFSDTEEYISVIDTVEPEVKYYHDDGLHLGHDGIRKLCSIIMSKLYKVLWPANHRARDRLYQIPHGQKRNSPIVVLIGLKILVNVVNRPMGFVTISASAAGMCSISKQSNCILNQSLTPLIF